MCIGRRRVAFACCPLLRHCVVNRSRFFGQLGAFALIAFVRLIGLTFSCRYLGEVRKHLSLAALHESLEMVRRLACRLGTPHKRHVSGEWHRGKRALHQVSRASHF